MENQAPILHPETASTEDVLGGDVSPLVRDLTWVEGPARGGPGTAGIWRSIETPPDHHTTNLVGWWEEGVLVPKFTQTTAYFAPPTPYRDSDSWILVECPQGAVDSDCWPDFWMPLPSPPNVQEHPTEGPDGG